MHHLQVGLGSPVFYKLEAELAKAVMSYLQQRALNLAVDLQIRTRTNRSGGIQRKQLTVTEDKKETEQIACGRHDPCVVPRAVPMVEAMVALVLVDQLAQYAHCCLFSANPELQEPFQLANAEKVNMSI
ncbi:Chorismate synthase [Euphorbia peplus]|nr:Chorismate synthase [Euphorbia peplus]